MKRYTFVIQVHPDGVSTLENLTTRERIRVSDMATVGAQIEQWLGKLPSSSSPAEGRREDNGESPSGSRAG
jgi:hypothetical protein